MINMESKLDKNLKKWFLLTDGVIKGPLSQIDMTQQSQSAPQSLIWGRGLPEWVSPGRWQKFLKEYEENISKIRRQSDRLWKIRIGGQELKPMSQSQMVDFLKSRSDMSDLQIWTEGYSEWKDIYQIHRIMDELGVSRRAHPRVPIIGTVTCENNGEPFSAKVQSVSEGGLGMVEVSQALNIGEKFKLVLKSPNLYAPIHASGEVVYVGADGYTGIKFLGLHTESKSAIIEYVKKFVDTRPVSS